MIQTFLEGEFFVIEKLLSNLVSYSGGNTVDNDSIGTDRRQNTFPIFMYLVPKIFLFTELKHNIHACINRLFYLSHDFGKSYLKWISHQLHFAFKNHFWDWSTGWCAGLYRLQWKIVMISRKVLQSTGNAYLFYECQRHLQV